MTQPVSPSCPASLRRALASLPAAPDVAAFSDASWPEIEALYAPLRARECATATDVEAWMAAWARIDGQILEASTRAMTAFSRNTSDLDARRRHEQWSEEYLPALEQIWHTLNAKALEWRHAFPDARLPQGPWWAALRREQALHVPDAAPLESEIHAHVTAYEALTATLVVVHDGTTQPVALCAGTQEDPDREVRERGWRAMAQAYLTIAPAINDAFESLHHARHRLATAAGCASIEAYAFAMADRPYTPSDAARLCEAIARVVGPVAARRHARRAALMGYTDTRPWDIAVPCRAATPLRFGTEDALRAAAHVALGAVDPLFAATLAQLQAGGNLDLWARADKELGAYSTTYDATGQAYIHMNACGTTEDLRTVIHETGHCVHHVLAQRQPWLWERQPGVEVCELAAIGMELLANNRLEVLSPQIGRAAVRQLQVAQLEDILFSFGRIAAVDSFQREAYRGPGRRDTGHERAAIWRDALVRYDVGVNWTQLAREADTGWMRCGHIFSTPFYYLEYALAQIGALQLLDAFQRDPALALTRYRHALALGMTRRVDALYAAMGTTLCFDEVTLTPVIDRLEAQLDALTDAMLREGDQDVLEDADRSHAAATAAQA